MIPVFQTQFTSEDNSIHGNCMAACLASIFELSIEDVPAFGDMEPGEWHIPFYQFLHKYGYTSNGVEDNVNKLKDYKGVNGYVMVAGKSPRSYVEKDHAVIYKDGELVHDPHPSGEGIKKFEYYYLIDKL